MNESKQEVHDFWNKSSCGEDLYLIGTSKESYIEQANSRYELEGNIIFPFACFDKSKGLKVLEIGVGLGADHQQFAKYGADLYGIDLTKRAINHTEKRLSYFDLKSRLSVGDAEHLEFDNDQFDMIYSWGVLHHSPNTSKAVSEVYRVLKHGGIARIMIYHKWSMVGYMLWLRYALMRLRPWLSLDMIYAQYLESQGTKAYSLIEAQQMFSEFNNVKITTPLGHADLLESSVGQRHRGRVLQTAKKIYPRWFVRRFMSSSGLFMLVEAEK